MSLPIATCALSAIIALPLVAAETAPDFGEYVLKDGRHVIGIYHADTGQLQVFATASESLAVDAAQIAERHPIVPPVEAHTAREIAGLDIRLATDQAELKTVEQRGAMLDQDLLTIRQALGTCEVAQMELSRRLAGEDDREQKKRYSDLLQRHLDELATCRAAIARDHAARAAVDADLTRLRSEIEDIQLKVLSLQPSAPRTAP